MTEGIKPGVIDPRPDRFPKTGDRDESGVPGGKGGPESSA